jgi:hypothetical protein
MHITKQCRYNSSAAKLLLLAIAAVSIANGQRLDTTQRIRPGRIEPASKPVISGTAVTFSYPAVAQSTLFTGDFGFTIDVPAGATVLNISLSASSSVVLYARFGQDVDLINGQAIADYAAATGGGFATIHITGSPIQAGRYYIGIGVFTFGIATSGTLSPTYTIGCPFTLDSAGASFPASGGSGSVTVTAPPACGWTLTSSVPWIVLSSGTSGVGQKTIQYQVPANTGQPRAATLTIGGQIYTVNEAGAQAPLISDNALLLPQLVGGGTWGLTAYITNLSATSEGFTLRFYDLTGAPLSMPIDQLGTKDTITGILASGETTVIATGAAPSLQQGWAVLTPDSPTGAKLSGFAIFRFQPPGASPSEAIVSLLGPKDRRFVLVYDNRNGAETGVALANPSATNTLAIAVTVRNQTGQTVVTDTITLAPLARTTFVMSLNYPSTAGQQGSVALSASPSGMAGLGLRFSPLGTFTSFPLLTSPDIQ